MESTLHDFHRSYRWRVSPYQNYLNTLKKQEIITPLKQQVNFIWVIPVALTVMQLMKPDNRNLALAKYLSYIAAFAYSQWALHDTKFKLDQYNIRHPRPPQIQLEAIRNAEIYKAHMK
jgi:hypothetical protein